MKKTAVEKDVLVKNAMEYLRIIVISKDDAVGLLSNELGNSLGELEKYLYVLELANQESNCLKHVSKVVTCKMHEVLQHVRNQTNDMGSPRCFSSSIGEFKHPVNKKFMKSGSLRLQDQSRTVLEKSYYDFLFNEVELFHVPLNIRREDPFEMTVRYRLLNIMKKGAVNELRSIFMNFWNELLSLDEDYFRSKIQEEFERLLEIFVSQDVQFGTGLECSLVCRKRNVLIKTPLKLSARPSSLIKKNKLLSIVSYSPDKTASSCFRRPKACLAHGSFELFRSFKNVQTSQFGIPVIFFKESSNTNEGSMVILELTSEHGLHATVKPDDLPVIKRFKKKFCMKLIPFENIRDRCDAVIHDAWIYVFTAGSRTYEHL